MPDIVLVLGDITAQAVDAVTNAANSSLLGGGGVDGAIHRKGGPAILEACRRLRAERYPDGLPTGQAVATPAGRLPAKRVIHTVGPVYSRREDRSHFLASCHREALRGSHPGRLPPLPDRRPPSAARPLTGGHNTLLVGTRRVTTELAPASSGPNEPCRVGAFPGCYHVLHGQIQRRYRRSGAPPET
jgi:Macro domain